MAVKSSAEGLEFPARTASRYAAMNFILHKPSEIIISVISYLPIFSYISEIVISISSQFLAT